MLLQLAESATGQVACSLGGALSLNLRAAGCTTGRSCKESGTNVPLNCKRELHSMLNWAAARRGSMAAAACRSFFCSIGAVIPSLCESVCAPSITHHANPHRARSCPRGGATRHRAPGGATVRDCGTTEPSPKFIDGRHPPLALPVRFRSPPVSCSYSYAGSSPIMSACARPMAAGRRLCRPCLLPLPPLP